MFILRINNLGYTIQCYTVIKKQNIDVKACKKVDECPRYVDEQRSQSL